MSTIELNFSNDQELNKKKSVHKLSSSSNISKINFNYSPDLKKKKGQSIKKSSTYQVNSDEILLNDSLFDNNDHSKSLANDISNLTDTNPRNRDTLRGTLTLFFIKNQFRKHAASSSATLTNENNKIQITYKSILKVLLDNFSLFIFGSVFSVISCTLLIMLTYLLRRTFNIIDYEINSDNFTYFNIEHNVSYIYLNCNFCYFAVWTTTSCFTLAFPCFFIYYIISVSCLKAYKSNDEKPASVCRFLITSFHFFNKVTTSLDNKTVRIEPIKLREFCIKILLTTILWILTGYTFLKALDLIYISDFIILFSVNVSFTYMATWTILQRQFLPLRLLGFILAIAAIIFIYYSDGFAFDLKFLGNLFATLSAAGSAILYIIWHDVTDRKDNGQRTMFLSLIGLCNLMLGWPLIFILEITGIETLSLTLNKESIDLEQKTLLISYLVTASVIGLCYVLVQQFGHLFTNQLYVQFGGFLAIPVSLLIDIKINDLIPSDLKIGAFISITTGYLLLIIPENFYTYLNNHFWPETTQELIETHSLTRRYRPQTMNSPSPVLHH